MKWVWASLICFIGGSIYFLTDAIFDLGVTAFWVYDWDSLCYIWETTLTTLLLMTIRNFMPVHKRWIIKAALYYSFITILWEITAPITEINKNHPVAVNIGFLVLSVGVAISLLKDLRQRRWEQNS